MQSESYTGHGGRILASGRRGAFFLTETKYEAGDFIPKHAHQHDCFSVVLGGAYQEGFGHLTLDGDRSSVIFRPAGEMHHDRIAPTGAHCLLIEPDRCWTRRLRGGRALLPRVPVQSVGQAVALGWKLYHEFRLSDDLSSMVIEGLVLELAAATARGLRLPSLQRPPWLSRAREMLRSSFHESPSLTCVARQVGVHPVSLARAFRRHYGCTVGEYIRQLRVNYVCARLLRSDDPLVEITYAAGFSHQAHLCKTFKRAMGLSPAQFRRLRRAD
jgi:AraC family transcriptional regulator